MEFRKPKTNPRNIVRELREKFLNDDFASFEIRGFLNNQVHEWEFTKVLNWGNQRSYVQLRRHTVIEPETGNIIYNESIRRTPFEEIVQVCLFMIDDQILNNDNLIITYIQEDQDVKYNCRGNSQRPSPRCYDLSRIPAMKIATKVKSALANPYTELGRRRIMSDFIDLNEKYPINKSSFGKKKNKELQINGMISNLLKIN